MQSHSQLHALSQHHAASPVPWFAQDRAGLQPAVPASHPGYHLPQISHFLKWTIIINHYVKINQDGFSIPLTAHT